MQTLQLLPALVVTFLASVSTAALPQDTSCDPASRPRAAGPLIFDEARESDLGDAVHEHLQSLFLPIEDPALVSYLQTVGERVRPYITGADSRIRYLLSDAPWVQAVSQVGGRIYVTRRMAAFVKEGEYVLEVIAARTGKTVGSVVFTRGSEMSYIRRAQAAAGVLAVEDGLDRVSIYSLADGSLRQRLFARQASLSPSGTSVAAENTPGRLTIYDVASGEKRTELAFAHPLAFGRFVDDGRILAVTADQVAYLVDVPIKPPPQP